MTKEESAYFFHNYPQKSVMFDIKDYLFALGCADKRIIQEFKSKYGCIEEEYVTEWLEALIPYFTANKSVESLKLSTQNEIYLENKSNVTEGYNYLEESKENWAGDARVLIAFYECLKGIEDFAVIQNHLDKIFPMICQVIDDFRTDSKLKGVQLMTEFLRIVPSDAVIKFNLNRVIYESLKVNVTFESDELVTQSINIWIGLIGKVEAFPEKEFLKRSDELLLLICRDVVITSKSSRKILLLKGIGNVVDLMQYTSIRYLRKIVSTLCEAVREDFTDDLIVKAGEESMIIVIKNCWIRMKDEDLVKMVRETFGGNETIERLLNLI